MGVTTHSDINGHLILIFISCCSSYVKYFHNLFNLFDDSVTIYSNRTADN